MPKASVSPDIDITKVIQTIPPLLDKLPAILDKLPSVANSKAGLFAKNQTEAPKSGCGAVQTVNVNVNVTEPEDCLTGTFKAIAGLFRKAV